MKKKIFRIFVLIIITEMMLTLKVMMAGYKRSFLDDIGMLDSP